MSGEVFRGLGHVGLYTDKYDETLKFYTEVLPFTLVKELDVQNPGDTSGFFPLKYAIVKLNDLYIEIMECLDKRNWNGITGTFHHIGISVSDIDQAIAYLLKRGFPAERISKPGVNTTLYPGKTFRVCSFSGICGEAFSFYEMENKSFFDEK